MSAAPKVLLFFDWRIITYRTLTQILSQIQTEFSKKNVLVFLGFFWHDTNGNETISPGMEQPSLVMQLQAAIKVKTLREEKAI